MNNHERSESDLYFPVPLWIFFVSSDMEFELPNKMSYRS